jgi:hypothetical protein
MNVLKLSQRADAVFSVVFLLLAVYWGFKGSYVWSGIALLSSAASFLSAKYVPARWLLKRMMLARLK